MSGCEFRGPTYEHTLTANFRGPVWFVVDPASAGLPVVNTFVQVVVPADGIFRVRTLRPFITWHESFGTMGGVNCAVELEIGASRVHFATVGLWVERRGESDEGIDYLQMFVGTKSEFEHERQNPTPFPVVK